MSISDERASELLGAELPAEAESPQITMEDASVGIPEERAQALLSVNFADSNTGQEIPDQALGLTPDSASGAKAILDPMDRAMLTLGNEAGQIKFLKEKYGDATVNSAGRLVAKVDGVWRYADPNWEETESPWEYSKEMFNDIVSDAAGPAMLMGGAIVGNVAGAAAGEYFKTSLGRYAGTYEATPVEQTMDIGTETLWELTGQKILPGMRPTASKAIKSMEKWASKLASTVDEKTGLKVVRNKAADMFWDFYGNLSVGEVATQTFRENPEQVLKVMKENGGGWSTPSRYIGNIVESKIEDVMKLAKNADKMAGNAYRRFRSGIVKVVPDNFAGSSNQLSFNAYLQMYTDGATEFLDKNGRKLAGKELADGLVWAKQQGRLPIGWTSRMKSQSELLAMHQSPINTPQVIGEAATDVESYKALRAIHDYIGGFSSKPSYVSKGGKLTARRGKAEAERLLDDNKKLKGQLYDVAERSARNGYNVTAKYLNDMRKSMDNQVAEIFGKYNLKDDYLKMNNVYSTYTDELKPLSKTWKNYERSRDKTVFESLSNQLSAQPGKNAVRKGVMNNMADLAEQVGDTAAAAEIRGINSKLKAADAAIALNPLARKGAAEAGIMIYGVASANAPLVAAASGKAFIGNPRMHQTALRSNHLFWETLKQIKGMPRAQTEFLLNNPAAANQFLRTIRDAQQTEDAISQTFNSMFPPAPQRGPGDE